MKEFEQELEAMAQELTQEPEVALPSLEEQKAIAAELRRLEEEGKLTPEILEHYFGKFSEKGTTPIH
ncbi:restriction endonuclease subunit S [Vibrio sp. SM6]|uniref:Restriction endonuclease subunit S n=1 Tax=Vibrio agarilyticus TaxID=2726741 RepID=A0A7X8TNJ1_9VIBR|nr:restriction endonuclease subunit S [Vibrio agarilyticus]NLS11747.1 restriction endonuclease subunit S [Vibrio agarilyticus]